jgi:hypothetical protein
MDASVTIHNSLREAGALHLEQTGIRLGLNGMAVGGKRLITIPPSWYVPSMAPRRPTPGFPVVS